MLSVELFLPSKDSLGNLLGDDERESVRYYVESELSRLFGGTTSTEGQGAWINSKGELMRERVTIIQSFADDEDARQNWDKVQNIAKYVKDALRQESVLVRAAPVQMVQFV